MMIQDKMKFGRLLYWYGSVCFSLYAKVWKSFQTFMKHCIAHIKRYALRYPNLYMHLSEEPSTLYLHEISYFFFSITHYKRWKCIHFWPAEKIYVALISDLNFVRNNSWNYKIKNTSNRWIITPWGLKNIDQLQTSMFYWTIMKINIFFQI